MPLSASTLKGLIKTNIQADFETSDADWLDQFAQAIADAVVTHITTSALVTVPSVSGVTPGPGASGPGTGTIS